MRISFLFVVFCLSSIVISTWTEHETYQIFEYYLDGDKYKPKKTIFMLLLKGNHLAKVVLDNVLLEKLKIKMEK